VTKDWKKTASKEHHNLYYSADIVKTISKDGIDEACSMHESYDIHTKIWSESLK
jgi:hypothetical protein